MLNNNQVQLFGESANLNPKSCSTLISTSSTSSLGSNQRNCRDTINNKNNLNQVQSNPVQIQNYITWINSHLKKRPGVRLVENLSSDLSNGVSLIHLIEVISGTVLTDVNLNPKTTNECKENIEKILKFMQLNSIKMHQTTSKEILEGNLKSIMRLVLALAAHFKPTNVQPYAAFISKISQNNTQTPQTTSSTNLNTLMSNNCKQQQQQQQHMINKRSQSTNNVNSTNNNNMNKTFVVNNQPLTQQSNTKPSLKQTRNLDSMTHLVQAACVSLADVRKYKNENNFNIKFVKRNNLDTTTNSSNYLNPINLNSDSTFTLPNMNVTNYINKTCNQFSPPKNSTMIASSFLQSPNAAQPIASSTVIQSATNVGNNNNLFDTTTISMDRSVFYNMKSLKNKTYSVADNREERIDEEQETGDKMNDDNNNENKELQNEISPNNNNNNDVNQYENLSKSNENTSGSTNGDNQTDTKTVCNDATNSNSNTEIVQNQISNHNEILLQNIFDENEVNIAEVQSVKTILLNLQKILMTCDMNDLKPEDLIASVENELNSSNLSGPSNLPYEEKIAILKSEIQQLENYNAELKNELNQYKTEHINKNGIQSGLKSRINEQNNTILEMKNEQINLQLSAQNLSKEKEELKTQLSNYQAQIDQFKLELSNKDCLIDRLKSEINELVHERDEQAKIIRQQVKQVSETLDIVQEKENTLSGMIANTDRKLNIIATHTTKKEIIINAPKEELSTIKDSLGRLRHQFGHSHPSHVLINTIEQNLNNFLERSGINPALVSSSTSGSSSLTSSSANSPVQHVQSQSPSSVHSSSSSISAVSNYSHKSSDTKIDEQKPEQNESNVKKIISRLLSQTYTLPTTQQNGNLSTRSDSAKPNKINNQMWENFCNNKQKSASSLLTISTNIDGGVFSQNSSANSSANSSCNNSGLGAGTKCVYYMDKNATPFVISLSKALGVINLMDLKEAIKLKHGNYRFRFKFMDPEFGIVKKEVSNDGTLLPGYEGKIVVWIETIM